MSKSSEIDAKNQKFKNIREINTMMSRRRRMPKRSVVGVFKQRYHVMTATKTSTTFHVFLIYFNEKIAIFCNNYKNIIPTVKKQNNCENVC